MVNKGGEMPAVSKIVVKENATWELTANFGNASVRLYLVSKADRREYPEGYMGLNEVEWNRLVRWVDYQRAEEALSRS